MKKASVGCSHTVVSPLKFTGPILSAMRSAPSGCTRPGLSCVANIHWKCPHTLSAASSASLTFVSRRSVALSSVYDLETRIESNGASVCKPSVRHAPYSPLRSCDGCFSSLS